MNENEKYYEQQQHYYQQPEHNPPTNYGNNSHYTHEATTTSYDNGVTSNYEEAGYGAVGYNTAGYYDEAAYNAAGYEAESHGDYEEAGYGAVGYKTAGYNDEAAYNGTGYEAESHGYETADYYPVQTKSVAPEVVAQRSRDAVATPLNMKAKEVKRAVELGGGLDLFTKSGVDDEHYLEGVYAFRVLESCTKI